MRLEDLRTFAAVAQAQGVTGAARRLGVSKSIVSRRLARLEASLNVRLIARTTRGATLTEAGETLHEHAVRITAECEAAVDALSPAGELRGRLRIAAPISYGTLELADVISAFAAAHPGLQVQAAYSDRIVDLVGGGFDVALRVGFLPDSRLMAQRLKAIDGRMVASPAYLAAHGEPVSPEDLINHDMVALGTETWPLRNGGQVISVRPRARFTADSGAGLVAAAIAGLGLALLPDFLADEHIATGRLQVAMRAHPMPQAALFAVRPPAGRAPMKVDAFVRFLRDRLR
ncbi:LysR family transcriptional regulator [Phenylobacterium koreense]|uniref:DNA-binding transcriptional LysR family regulator n=1 Tax=Phenylobacterium koreense TaxID=266125 RepID=A0ABV2EPP8_9CAUL